MSNTREIVNNHVIDNGVDIGILIEGIKEKNNRVIIDNLEFEKVEIDGDEYCGYAYVNLLFKVIPSAVLGGSDENVYCLSFAGMLQSPHKTTAVVLPDLCHNIEHDVNLYIVNLSFIKGQYVDDLNDYLFTTNEELRAVIFPNAEYVGTECFARCTALEKVDVSGAKVVKAFCFEECYLLTDVKLCNNLTVLEEGTFASCKNLEYLTLPSKLKEIQSKCFQNCEKLKDLILPDGVEYIGDYVFQNCSSLRNLKIPHGCKTIESFAFDGMKDCTIFIPNSVENLGDIFSDKFAAASNTIITDSPSIAIICQQRGYNCKFVKREIER